MQGCYSNDVGWRDIFSHSKGLLYHVMFQCSWNLRELTRTGLHFSSQTSQWQTPSPCVGNGSVSFLCCTPLVASRTTHASRLLVASNTFVRCRASRVIRPQFVLPIGTMYKVGWDNSFFVSGHTIGRRILDPHCKYSLEPFKMTVKLVTGCERFCAGNLLMV